MWETESSVQALDSLDFVAQDDLVELIRRLIDERVDELKKTAAVHHGHRQPGQKEIEVLIDARVEAILDTRAEQTTANSSAHQKEVRNMERTLSESPLMSDPDIPVLGFQDEIHSRTKPLSFQPLNPSKEEVEWHCPFGENTYTLFYMCPYKSQGFWYAIFVYALQSVAIILTLLDVIDLSDLHGNNPLHLPPMVDLTVTCAQAVTLFLVLGYQSDVIEAILKLQDGWYPDVLSRHSGANYSTWFISCIAQLSSGLLLLTTSFILTTQSSTVLVLMLNLTALLFMAEIDDIAFSLAKMGFITDHLQHEAVGVCDIQVPKQKRSNFYRRLFYGFSLIGLFVGYGVLKARQVQGYYLQTHLYVQFGDAFDPTISFYSGMYSYTQVGSTGYRDYHDVATSTILLAYCKNERAWTFSRVDDDPCVDYFAMSSETTSYDVASLGDQGWMVRDSFQRMQSFDAFSLVGRDCDTLTCQGTCGPSGLCECSHDQFGLDCEFIDVCAELIVDNRFGGFPAMPLDPTDPEKAISNAYQILRNETSGNYAKAYHMPVYYSNKTYPANIIFFGGRRWVLTTEWDFLNRTMAGLDYPYGKYFAPEQTLAIFQDEFHGHHKASYSPVFTSDPMDYGSPQFQPTPVGLAWWTVKAVNESERGYYLDEPLEVILACRNLGSCIGQPYWFCGGGGTASLALACASVSKGSTVTTASSRFLVMKTRTNAKAMERAIKAREIVTADHPILEHCVN